MKILLSNDDGYSAVGLVALADAVAPLADTVTVAPDRNQSGSSYSLTLDAPLRVGNAGNNVYFVNGTPTDCVHLAITGLLDDEPDMVIAGINHGSNLGDDVLYSGTVAAAVEGRFLGFPAIAVSLVGENPVHFAAAGRVVRHLLEKLQSNPLAADTILNVNVPDVEFNALQGFQATRLGYRHRAEPVITEQDPKGKTIYWVGPAGSTQDASLGTDFYAIENNYVSVTPLQVDLTQHARVQVIRDWLEK